jgi:predicted kinase
MSAHLILVTGAPGSGKSTLAARLVARYGCVLLDKDTIKEALFDVLGTGDARWSRSLSDASFAVQFALAAPLLARGQSLLLEGNFRPGEHEPPLGRLLAARPAACAQILVSAAAEVRAARLAARTHDAGRHAGHADVAANAHAAASGPLALPGALFSFAGDGDEPEFEHLCRALDRWWAAVSTSP